MADSISYLSKYREGQFYTTVRHVEFFRRGVAEGQIPADWLFQSGIYDRSALVTLNFDVDGFGEYAWLDVPHFDTVSLLEAFYADFLEAGGVHLVQTVDRSTVESVSASHVFNCLGINAGSMFGDHTLEPVFGQAIRYPPSRWRFGLGMGDFFVLSSQFGFYLGSPFIRGDGVFGPKRVHYEDLSKFLRTTLPKAAAVVGLEFDGSQLGPPLETVSGIRPFRPGGARVEVERSGSKLVVHNYGHGAHGWAAGWGAAVEAVTKWEGYLHGIQGLKGPRAAIEGTSDWGI
jgi:glycine/D-amino acid oxidase-like deaminating enzyme